MKKYPWLTLAAVCCLSFLSAAEYEAPDEEDDDEDMKKTELPEYKQQMDVHGRSEVDGALDAYVYAGVTYWNANAGDGIITDVTSSTSQIDNPLWKVTTRPGFLIGFGFLSPETLVDVTAQYTWFYNKQNRNDFSTTTVAVPNEFFSGFRTVGGSLANTFNRFEIMVNKRIYFGDYFDFAPGAGFVGNWSEFWFDRTYSANANGTGTQVDANNDQLWGFGPYFQGKSNFIAPKCFGSDWFQFIFLAKAGIGFCWQHNDTTFQRTSTYSGQNSFQSHAETNGLSTLLDGILGIRWQMMGEDLDSVRFSVELNWTVQAWSNYTSFLAQGTQTAYYLQGLTAGLGVGF